MSGLSFQDSLVSFRDLNVLEILALCKDGDGVDKLVERQMGFELGSLMS